MTSTELLNEKGIHIGGGLLNFHQAKSSLRKEVERRIVELEERGSSYLSAEWKEFLELIETTLPD